MKCSIVGLGFAEFLWFPVGPAYKNLSRQKKMPHLVWTQARLYNKRIWAYQYLINLMVSYVLYMIKEKFTSNNSYMFWAHPKIDHV